VSRSRTAAAADTNAVERAAASRSLSSCVAREKGLSSSALILLFWRVLTICGGHHRITVGHRRMAQGRRHVIYVFSPPPRPRPRLFPTTTSRPMIARRRRHRRGRAVAAVSRFRDAFRSCVIPLQQLSSSPRSVISETIVFIAALLRRNNIITSLDGSTAIKGSVGYYALWS